MQFYIGLGIWSALIGVAMIVPGVKSASTCPIGFTISQNGQWCFSYGTHTVTWPVSSLICRSYFSKLATIEDATKDAQIQAFIQSEGKSGSQRIHMGGTDIISDQQWVWYLLPNDFNYTNWDNGEPTNAPKYACLNIIAGNPDYKWHDEKCLNSRNYICQTTPTDT